MIILLGSRTNLALKGIQKTLTRTDQKHLLIDSFAALDITLEMTSAGEWLQCSLSINGRDCSTGHTILNWIEQGFFGNENDGEYAIMERYSSLWAYLANTQNHVINRPTHQGFKPCFNPLSFTSMAAEGMKVRSREFASDQATSMRPITDGSIEAAIYWKGVFSGWPLEGNLQKELERDFQAHALHFAIIYLYTRENRQQVLAYHRLSHIELPEAYAKDMFLTHEDLKHG